MIAMLRSTVVVMSLLAAVSPARAVQGTVEGREPPLLQDVKPADAKWAEGLFEELSFDFGTVPMGQKLVHPFRIVNNTKDTVHIESVRVSMGSLTHRALQYTLAPGQETAIVVQMDTRTFRGVRKQGIFVTFDSPRLAEVQLMVQANSRDDLVFTPDSIDFNKIKRGTTPTQQMAVTFLGKPKILVTGAKCDSNFILLKLLELRREGNEVIYQVSATVRCDLPLGKWYTDIWLTTNDADLPKLRVPVMLEMEPPVLEVKICRPAEALIDQPITFKVEVRNKGIATTDKNLSLVVHTGDVPASKSNSKASPLDRVVLPPSMDPQSRRNMPDPASPDFVFDLPGQKFQATAGGWSSDFASWAGNHLPVGCIKPNETRTLTFTMTPKRAKFVQVSVYQAEWHHGTFGFPSSLTPISNVDTAGVQVKYDPKTPLDVLLPRPPQEGKPRHGLPQTLAEVPEVFFQEPLTNKMNTQFAQLQTARVIDRINYLNAKKRDAFVVAMTSKRRDLVGLPFLMGDDCRMKDEDSRQFVAALAKIREAEQFAEFKTMTLPQGQRPRSSAPTIPPAPSPNTNETPVTIADKSDLMELYGPVNINSNVHPFARVASLMQVLGPASAADRHGLAKYLEGESHVAATRALAKLAIFSEEPQIRKEAVKALRMRRDRDYSDILLSGLSYPWPAVAERSSEAIAQLGRTDLIPQLIEVLARPDPRTPQEREVVDIGAQGLTAGDGDGRAGKPVLRKAAVVREVVRLNHLHNCLLCHAPATADPNMSEKDKEHFAKLTAQVPVPGESLTAYYRPSNPDILVRLDVTYLRQDFSLNLPVKDAAPWPDMQRYDYLVRTRTVTEQEAGTLRQLLTPKAPAVLSPYQLAAQAALRELTGLDAEPTAVAWTAALRK